MKGFYGLLEIALGSIILFFNRHIVVNFLLYFVQGELNEDPRDWIANQLLHFSNHLTPSSEFFMGAYFLVNGIVKIILVYGLLRSKLWSYPAAMAFIGLFGIYEVYRYLHTHSLILSLLILFDIAVIFLVWHEYYSQKKSARM